MEKGNINPFLIGISKRGKLILINVWEDYRRHKCIVTDNLIIHH